MVRLAPAPACSDTSPTKPNNSRVMVELAGRFTIISALKLSSVKTGLIVDVVFGAPFITRRAPSNIPRVKFTLYEI